MADTPARAPEVTRLLKDWRDGRREGVDRLFALIYDELRRLARRQLAREHSPHTLQATDLVHEAFVRLVDQKVAWQNRAHFFGIAATCMRRVLVDHARRKQALKRPQALAAVALDESVQADAVAIDRLLALDEALARLDPRQACVAELRLFGGLEVDDISALLGISPATVKRDWSRTKHLLQDVLMERRRDP